MVNNNINNSSSNNNNDDDDDNNDNDNIDKNIGKLSQNLDRCFWLLLVIWSLPLVPRLVFGTAFTLVMMTQITSYNKKIALPLMYAAFPYPVDGLCHAEDH